MNKKRIAFIFIGLFLLALLGAMFLVPHQTIETIYHPVKELPAIVIQGRN